MNLGRGASGVFEMFMVCCWIPAWVSGTWAAVEFGVL